ncbi:MAG: hypothetical protein ACE5D7_07580, partial [Fidelibacterota bacterium]
SVNVQDVVIIVTIILQTFDCPIQYSPCSDNLSECCLIPTSHEFEWVADTMGIYGSELRASAIVNPDSIWVFGEIRIPDTTSQTGYTNYGGAWWDGTEWHLKHFYWIDHLAQVYPRGVWLGEDNDMWFAGGNIWYYNGDTTYQTWDSMEGSGGNVNRVWGDTNNNLYFVGPGGAIVHFDGTEYTQMESGTDVKLIDISGDTNGDHVFVTGLNIANWFGSVVLELIDGEWHTIYEAEHYLPSGDDYGATLNVSVLNDTAYISTMAGLWKYNFLDQNSAFIPESSYNEGQFFHTKYIKAQEVNDIYMLSSRFIMTHFNGDNWFYDNQFNVTYGDGNIWSGSGDYNGEIAVFVGYFYPGVYPLIVRGYKF